MAPRSAEQSGAEARAARSSSRSKAAVKTAPEKHVPKDILEGLETEVPRMGQNYKGLLSDNFEGKPLMKRLNWLHVPLICSMPFIAAYGVYHDSFNWRTWVFAVFYYFVTGFGITAGYHRLFAHRAYKATPFMRAVLMLMGTGAVEGSVRWWARDHRAHHRYVDTDKDPYAATKGFWYAHVGWMLVKQDKERIGRADVKDLYEDGMLTFQHKWYLPLAAVMGIAVPTAVCGALWGDWWGGYFVAGVLRLFFVHHSTFFVNSLAHYAGSATYTDGHTARNSILTALLTLGEGYHNFHHEFPNDYRNGVEWWQYDPTKLFIWSLSLLGLTYDLNEFDGNEIAKGQLQMRAKALEAEKTRVNWGPNPSALPEWSMEQFKAEAAKTTADGKKRSLMVLDGFVVDATAWKGDHPGGDALLNVYSGTDVTALFKGGHYKHSNAGRNMAATLRVARIKDYVFAEHK